MAKRKLISLPYTLRKGDRLELIATGRALLRIKMPRNVTVKVIKRD